MALMGAAVLFPVEIAATDNEPADGASYAGDTLPAALALFVALDECRVYLSQAVRDFAAYWLTRSGVGKQVRIVDAVDKDWLLKFVALDECRVYLSQAVRDFA